MRGSRPLHVSLTASRFRAHDHLSRAPGIKTQEPVELPKPTSFCERMWGRLLVSGTFFQVFKTSGWLLHQGFLER